MKKIFKNFGKKLDNALGNPSHLNSSIPEKRKVAEEKFFVIKKETEMKFEGNNNQSNEMNSETQDTSMEVIGSLKEDQIIVEKQGEKTRRKSK